METLVREKLYNLSNVRIALVHYWYVRRRGGERVLDAMAEAFPHADIFVMVADPSNMPEATRSHKITTSFMQRIPGIKRHYRKLMPLMPMALESFNLDDYDIVISHEAGPAKGVLTKSRTLHINYSHSPIRYVWEMYQQYLETAPGGAVGRLLYSLASHYMRLWDYSAAARVDHFIASSENGANRIGKFYRRSADVIYPPANLEHLYAAPEREDFYLIVSPLVIYKRVDLAILACNKLGRRLKIIGAGEQRQYLEKIAGPTVEFLGFQTDEVVREHYSRCRAFLFPGEEDIGLTPIEAQASGAPVIAFAAGGALETVRGFSASEGYVPGSTGIFFDEPSPESLSAAILAFEQNATRFVCSELQVHASQFSEAQFRKKFVEAVSQLYVRQNSKILEKRIKVSV